MTIPFPFRNRRTPDPAPSTAPTQKPPKSAGPVLVENLVAAKLSEIRERNEKAALASLDTVPDKEWMHEIRTAANDEIQAMHRPPFDPERNPDDRLIQARLESLREREKQLENRAFQEKAIADKAADQVAAAPHEHPQASVPVVICGVLAFAIEVAASIQPLLSQWIEDGPTVFAAAGAVGIVVGVVIVYGAMGIGGNES